MVVKKEMNNYTTEEINKILALIGEFDENLKSKKTINFNGKKLKFQLVEETDDLIGSLAYLMASKYRVKVINTLAEDTFKTPKEISNETGIIMNHISNILTNLKKNNLIICVNEGNRKGRLYTLTPLGIMVKEKLSEHV